MIMSFPQFPNVRSENDNSIIDDSNGKNKTQLSLMFPLPAKMILDYQSRAQFILNLVQHIQTVNYYSFDFVINQDLALVEVKLKTNTVDQEDYTALDIYRQLLFTMDQIIDGIKEFGINEDKNCIVEQILLKN